MDRRPTLRRYTPRDNNSSADRNCAGGGPSSSAAIEVKKDPLIFAIKLEDRTGPASLGGYPGLQFLELLFELDDDTADLIKTGANSRDHLSGGLILVPQPLQLLFHSQIFPQLLHVRVSLFLHRCRT